MNRSLLLVALGATCAAATGCAAQAPSSACGASATESFSAWEDPITVLDRYDGPSFAELQDVEVDGDRVWFCSAVQGLNVYDAADPAALTLLGRVGPSAGSQQYPRCQHLAVQGDRVYVTNRTSTISRDPFIAVFDASTPSELSELGTLLLDDEPEGITVHGELLLVAVHTHLVVFRRGDGAELTELGRVDGLGNAWTVRAVGDLAYVADADGGLSVVDLADPAAPALVTRLDVPGAVKDLAIDGDRAVLAAGTAGVALVSLADPRAPVLVEIEDTPGSALGVALGDGDAVYVSDWNDLRVFDGLAAMDLRPVASEPLPEGDGAESRSLGLAARGDVLFSGNWTELVSYRFHPLRSAPDLNVSPRVAQLPPDDADGARVLLTLRNWGREPLTLSATEVGDRRLSVPDLEEGLVVPPGEEERVVLQLEPGVTESLESWVNLVSDDPDEGRKCVQVLANQDGIGVGEPAPEVAFLGLDGEAYRLSELTQQGPVLLAYFATF